jgi:hypothetical protein
MKDEEITGAVYDAALDYIYSVVPSKRIQDLDVSVSMDDGEVAIDIRLVSDRTVEIDQKTVEEAVKVASEKADELLGK